MKKAKIIISICLILTILSGGVFSIFYFWKQESDKKVVTTIFPIYDICRQILGDTQDLLLINDTGADMHSYQPTVHDIISISNAELFLYIGGESDKWVGDVIESSQNKTIKSLALLDYVEKLEESDEGIVEDSHGHDHDAHHEHDHEEHVYDEHIWLSLNNMISITHVILNNLIDIFPERESELRVNSNNFVNQLITLENEYNKALFDCLQTIVVADRFPFIYLVNDYDIDYVAAFSGCSSDTEASAETLIHLIEEINSNNVEYVLVLETSDRKIAERIISNSTCKGGVEILTINTCQSVSRLELTQTSYLDIMEQNLVNFKKAVGK